GKGVTAPRRGVFLHDSLVRYAQRFATTGPRGDLFRTRGGVVSFRDGRSRAPPTRRSAPPASWLSSSPRRSYGRSLGPAGTRPAERGTNYGDVPSGSTPVRP